MKEIWAVIRRDKLVATRKILDSIGSGSMSVHTISGRGKQRGFVQTETEARELPTNYSTSAPNLVETPSQLATEGATLTKPITYVPKKLISAVVPASMLSEIIDAIISVNQSGHHGDGKIFVFPIEEAYRIRTNEEGLTAIDN